MAKFTQTIGNIFKIEELRQRILFTFGILLVVRVGAFITLPGIDLQVLRASMGHFSTGSFWDIFNVFSASDSKDSLFNLLDMFVGGAFNNAAIFAVGIMPYITASIILQLGGFVIPQIQKMQKEGEEGRRKINQYTRLGTVVIAAMQGWGISIKLLNQNYSGIPVVATSPYLFTITTIILITAGTVFLMWLGEQITEKGIGNGISLIIAIGIVARFPSAIIQEIKSLFPEGLKSLFMQNVGNKNIVVDMIILLFLIAVIAGVTFITQGARRIPVQYAKRQVGRKVFGGTTQYIPIPVLSANVMPIIFAQSLIFIPATIASFFPNTRWLHEFANMFSERSYFYALVYSIMIILFTYFYTAIIFNPRDMADNIKKQGGFIPGIRPGDQTSEYFDGILYRITLPGSIFLAIVAILPTFMMKVFGVDSALASFFGGTSLLIVVGVALDTLNKIESYLLMRHYDGFMKSGRIKGRSSGSY
ncbi:MAG: preprotein translocase subunit SecY [Candidatus Kapabacteria bacterium]|nr:preprotein translocase subunit SecY [Candidatus Kapabacteria bacterium]